MNLLFKGQEWKSKKSWDDNYIFSYKTVYDLSIEDKIFLYIESYFRYDSNGVIYANINYCFNGNRKEILFPKLIGKPISVCQNFFDNLTYNKLKLYMVFG